MHELSLCKGILRALADDARAQGYQRVKTVRLEVGALSGIRIEALRLNFQAAARGTLADRATLEVVEVPGAAWCARCEKTMAVAQRFDACPGCGGQSLQLTAGTEMRIQELEVE